MILNMTLNSVEIMCREFMISSVLYGMKQQMDQKTKTI